ncbi:MAG TPA: NUDIX hydrolase [Candidatus Limnocylindrales bacterium]
MSEPEPRPSIAVAVVTAGNRALLVRRRIAEGALSWQFPSGAIEPGESALDAARRETLEEVGLDVTAAEILGERIHPITDRHMIYVTCEAPEPSSASVVDTEELAELAWCTWPEVQNRIPSGISEPIAAYLASLPD